VWLDIASIGNKTIDIKCPVKCFTSLELDATLKFRLTSFYKAKERYSPFQEIVYKPGFPFVK
jgi:hypothetical protein